MRHHVSTIDKALYKNSKTQSNIVENEFCLLVLFGSKSDIKFELCILGTGTIGQDSLNTCNIDSIIAEIANYGDLASYVIDVTSILCPNCAIKMN